MRRCAALHHGRQARQLAIMALNFATAETREAGKIPIQPKT
jgi:hypothetical protein